VPQTTLELVAGDTVLVGNCQLTVVEIDGDEVVFRLVEETSSETVDHTAFSSFNRSSRPR